MPKGRANKPLTDEQKILIVEMYSAGVIVSEMEEALSLHRGTIYKYVKEAGLPRRIKDAGESASRRLTYLEREKLFNMYSNGYLMTEIAEELGCSATTVHRQVRTNDIKRGLTDREKVQKAYKELVDNGRLYRAVAKRAGMTEDEVREHLKL